MASKNDYWKVVCDALCEVSVNDVVSEPEKEVGCTTKFLINFKVVIRRITSSDADRLQNLDDVISRTSVTETSLKLDSSNPKEATAISDALRKLRVPLSERYQMAQRIMHKACEAENKNEGNGSGKIVHISVYIDLIVVDDGGDDSDEDNIEVCCLEASHSYPDRSMVEQLKKTGVCLMCDNDREVFLGEHDLYSF